MLVRCLPGGTNTRTRPHPLTATASATSVSASAAEGRVDVAWRDKKSKLAGATHALVSGCAPQPLATVRRTDDPDFAR